MKILAIGAFFPAGPFRFLTEALEHMGHRVYRIGPCINEHGSVEWGRDRITADLTLPRELAKWDLPYYLDHCVRNFGCPDWVLLTEENYQTSIVPLPNSIPSALFVVDGHPEIYERHKVWQATVSYVSNCLGTAKDPREEVHPAWRWLPTGWAPWAHPRINFDQGLRTWDFQLHASPYGKRTAICEGLKGMGLKVRYGFVPTPDYVHGNNFSLFTYHNCQRNGQEIKYRAHEAMGMGCIVIADQSGLMLKCGYEPWKHFIPFPDKYLDEELWPKVDKLHRLIVYMKKNSDLHRIGDEAFKFTAENHTYINRCKTILEDLGFKIA